MYEVEVILMTSTILVARCIFLSWNYLIKMTWILPLQNNSQNILQPHVSLDCNRLVPWTYSRMFDWHTNTNADQVGTSQSETTPTSSCSCGTITASSKTSCGNGTAKFMKHEFAAASRLHQILQFLASAQELQTFDSEFKHIGIPWNILFCYTILLYNFFISLNEAMQSEALGEWDFNVSIQIDTHSASC